MAIWDLFKKKDTPAGNKEILEEESVEITVSSYTMKNESIFYEDPSPEDLDACTYQDKYLFHQDVMP